MIINNYLRIVPLVVALIFPPFISAQTIITHIFSNSESLTSTDKIKCTRFADFTEENAALNMSLNKGDVLESSGDGIKLGISYGENSVMIFSNRFSVIMMTGVTGPFAVQLLNGDVDIKTEVPTKVKSGETLMGSESTQYGVKAVNGNVEEILVYEGKISINSSDVLSQGYKVIKGGKKGEKGITPEVFTEKDLIHVSELYAKLDVTKAVYSGLAPTEAESRYLLLQKLYKHVFTSPGDSRYRQELAVEQSQLNLSHEAIYNLNVAEKNISRRDSTQLAQIYLNKGMIYKEINRQDRAEEEFNKAERYDKRTINKIKVIKGNMAH